MTADMPRRTDPEAKSRAIFGPPSPGAMVAMEAFAADTAEMDRRRLAEGRPYPPIRPEGVRRFHPDGTIRKAQARDSEITGHFEAR